MKEDNTPTVNARRRKPTAKQHLRSAIARDGKKAAKAETSLIAQGDLKASNEAPPRNAANAASGATLVRKFRKRQLNKSWLPTHLYHAKRAHMTPTSKPLWGFAIPLTPTEKSYRQTHRASTLRGCVAWDQSYMSSIQLTGYEQNLLQILRALSVPEAQLTGNSGTKWLRGLQSWSGWVHERENTQRPMAPITIIWSPQEFQDFPGNVRNLLFRLHPSAFRQFWQEILELTKLQRPAVAVQDLRFELGSIEIGGPGASEALVRILCPNSSDSQTRQHWPHLASVTNVAILPPNLVVGFSTADPRLRSATRAPSTSTIGHDGRLEIFSTWPHDNEPKPFELLDSASRKESCRKLLSQKLINRRRATQVIDEPTLDQSSDPSIPLILFTAHSKNDGRASNSWILLLPWEYVLPTWYCLMHVPLSSGGQPRFGGLQEQRQLAFETGTPWFPADFPGTEAGWAWELAEQERRKTDWNKQPKTKRTQWETIDIYKDKRGEIGRGWACDWELLFGHEVPKDGSAETDSANKAPDLNDLVAISLVFTNRGHASTCARIYRLPSSDHELRAAWLTGSAGKRVSGQLRSIGDGSTAAGRTHSQVPSDIDLVGFVTTGNYNLGEGQATAIGSVRMSLLQKDPETVTQGGRSSGLCIVRGAGMSIGKLAHWKACS